MRFSLLWRPLRQTLLFFAFFHVGIALFEAVQTQSAKPLFFSSLLDIPFADSFIVSAGMAGGVFLFFLVTQKRHEKRD